MTEQLSTHAQDWRDRWTWSHGSQEQRLWSKHHQGGFPSQYWGRKTWAVNNELLEAPCGQLWELKTLGGPSHRRSPTISREVEGTPHESDLGTTGHISISPLLLSWGEEDKLHLLSWSRDRTSLGNQGRMPMNWGRAEAAIPGFVGSQPTLSEVPQTGLCCVSPARKLPVGHSVSCPATTRTARAQSSVPLILSRGRVREFSFKKPQQSWWKTGDERRKLHNSPKDCRK